MNDNTWIILGASSAIARAFAIKAATKQANIILAGRDEEDLQRTAADIRLRSHSVVETLYFDASNFHGLQEFVNNCQQKAIGHLNIFLAYATMPNQSEMEEHPQLIEKIVETNYLSAMTLLTLFAKVLKQQKAGKIVALSSVSADRGRVKNYIYGSTKAGLHVFLQGLRADLFTSNVTVTTIKPGFIDTAMTFGEPGLFLVASPQDCAKACWRFAQKGEEVGYYPWFWRWIMLIIKCIPERIFKKLRF